MAKNILITGAGGFVGRHMCDYLSVLAERPNIIGVDIFDTPPNNCNSFYKMDLSSADDIAKLIKWSKPDYIIHFAGTFGTKDYQEIYRVNVLTIAALLEAAREHGHIEAQQLPLNEMTPCRPVAPYGLSKQLATQIALYYHRVHNICAMVVRPFQLIGKGVTSRLVPGAFAEQLKQTTPKGPNVIKVGNLESSRDFLDVHDAVEAIWTLCQKPAAGEIFNLCSSKPTKIFDLLQMMLDCCDVDVKVEVDPARMRDEADVSVVYGSFEKLNLHCGWQPKTSLKQSVMDTVSF